MDPSSTIFQPYDRFTGTELSQHQQETCRVHYKIIKAYIDGIESRTTPQWVRKQLRCSTAELFESLQHLVNDITQESHDSTRSHDGTTNVRVWVEQEDKKMVAMENGLNIAETDQYQQAVNLLHELISRLAESDVKPSKQSEAQTDSPFGQHLSPARVSRPNSTVSTTPSHVFASEISDTATGSVVTGSSKTSNDASRQPMSWSDVLTTHEKGVFEFDMLDEHRKDSQVTYDTRKDKATSEWVLEYLRGGWLAKNLATLQDSTISPFSPLTGNTSQEGSFGPLRRTASDEVSVNSDDNVALALKSATTSSRLARRGRPIPTVASRLQNGTTNQAQSHHWTSAVSGFEHFKTPRSIISGDTIYCTPDGGMQDSNAEAKTSTSAWNRYLRQKGLIPEPFEEMDWSGRGQHAEFDASEESEIPLTLEKTLGRGANGWVESVRCRRIRLARKTVQVSRRLKKEEAMKEVEHLQRLKHPHIIRVVGTYTIARFLCILVYPVATYTLDQFLESVEDGRSPEDSAARLYAISTFLRCLAKAIDYIHENAMKHMDIKPKNLLVRDMRSSTICNQGKYKIYVADFDIARSYRSIDDCDTETPTAFTRAYAAPEVVAQERRDQKADIFSLGAVYAEMLAVLATPIVPIISNLEILHQIRERDPTDHSYARHARFIQQWLRQLSLTTFGFESDTNHSHITELVARMLSVDPAGRPTAATIVNNIPFLAFCCDVNGGSEPFEAADRNAERQLYDRAMEIAEADARYWRCMVDGCVKVYSSREKLDYHTLNGHGGADASAPELDSSAEVQTSASAPSHVGIHEQIAERSERKEWSAFW